MREYSDIAVLGAGAAGLAAGIFAAEAAEEQGRARRIVLLDSAKTIGAKILVSGGGRCNVTHEQVSHRDFVPSSPTVRHILAAFSAQAARDWFASMGVALTREETGKLFPVTDKARTVLQALTTRCRDLNVTIRPRHRVSDVIAKDGFVVRHEQGELQAERVIMATGGRSLPRTGSDGYGWEIVRRLGHRVTDCQPALVPLVLKDSLFHADLSGLSQDTELTTLVDGTQVDRRTGRLLWTHFGVSGPVVMDASRFWTIAHAHGVTVEVRCNFLPGVGFDDAERQMIAQMEARPTLSVGKTLAQQVPERLALALCKHCGVAPITPAGRLARAARRTLVHALTGLPLPILRDRGWNYAEVTAGGVPLDEMAFRTMESRKVPGLHLIGEMLDCDGRIGGFNFQWAWATGYLAGRGAISGLKGAP